MDARDPCVTTYTSWRNLARVIAGDRFRREIEMTKAAPGG